MTRKTGLQRLDDIVLWTGIPAIAAMQVRRRSLRWTSTLALAASLLGFVVIVATGATGRLYRLGYLLMMVGFMIGIWMPMFGPLKQRFVEHITERDRLARSHAYLATFAVFAAMTFASLFAIVFVAVNGTSVEPILRLSTSIIFVLLTIVSAVPTCHASWTTHREKDRD